MSHSIICKKKMHILFFVVFMQAVCLFSSDVSNFLEYENVESVSGSLSHSLVNSSGNSLQTNRHSESHMQDVLNDNADNKQNQLKSRQKTINANLQFAHKDVLGLLFRLDNCLTSEQEVFNTILHQVLQTNSNNRWRVDEDKVRQLELLYDQQSDAALSVDTNANPLIMQKYHARLDLLRSVLNYIDRKKIANEGYNIKHRFTEYDKFRQISKLQMPDCDLYEYDKISQYFKERDMFRFLIPFCAKNNDLISDVVNYVDPCTGSYDQSNVQYGSPMRAVRLHALREYAGEQNKRYQEIVKNNCLDESEPVRLQAITAQRILDKLSPLQSERINFIDEIEPNDVSLGVIASYENQSNAGDDSFVSNYDE